MRREPPPTDIFRRESVRAGISSALIINGDGGITPHLRGQLERSGILVLDAADLDSALSLLTAVTVDAVILDLRPERTHRLDVTWGSVIDRLRQHVRPDSPIFVLVDRAHIAEQRLAAQLGVYLFATKRHSYRHLAHAILSAP
jgi:DNA-binding response OmpR family regulator